MATKRWIGSAEDVDHIITVTVAGVWVTGETATMDIGGGELKLTAGSSVATTDIAAALTAMINGDDEVNDETRSTIGPNVPQWSGLEATQIGSTVRIENTVAGFPFVLALAETAAAGSLSQATTQQATGKNWLNDPDNYSDGAIWGAGDTLVLDDSNVSIWFGLDQIADTLAELVVGSRFSGDLGLPEQNPAGYQNYLPRYAEIRATLVNIGLGTGGSGSSLIKIDGKTVQTTVKITGTGSGAIGGYAVQWKGSHASNSVTASGDASFASAILPEETATIASLTLAGNAQVFIGRGTSGLATVSVTGGDLENQDNAITALTQTGGNVFINGAAGVTTYTFIQGSAIYDSTGQITTMVLGGGEGASLDVSQDGRAKVIDSLTLKRNAEIIQNNNLTINTLVALDASVNKLIAA